MPYKSIAIAASTALAAGSVFLVALPSQAALTTRCTGVAGEVTVPGDLVVPRDSSCTLEGTTVLGTVRVQPGADLLADGATIDGDLVVASNGYADVLASTVGGNLTGRDQFGVFLEGSSVAGSLVQRSPGDPTWSPFVYAFDTDAAAVDSRAGEVLLESSTVQGDVRGLDGEFTDLIDSVVSGALLVRGNAFGSVVCESEIYGDAVYRGNASTLQIGGSGSVGLCDGASFWGGDVTFQDNTATENGFDISNNIVAGSLRGGGNDPLPTGAGNRVRGEVTLPFADPEAGEMSLKSQSGESVETQKRAQAVAESRAAELQAKIDQRRATAEKEAAATPSQEALVPGNG